MNTTSPARTNDQDEQNTPETSAVERTAVSLEVTYTDGEPWQIEYFHTIYGMVKFDVADDTAILDEKWDRLTDGSLKDNFERTLTTGDVIHSVQQLPFIETVKAPHHHPHTRQSVETEDE